MEANFKMFLKQSSQPEGLFKWCSVRNDYMYIKGFKSGHFVGDLIREYGSDEKDALEELYQETSNWHTKYILKDIVKIHYASSSSIHYKKKTRLI